MNSRMEQIIEEIEEYIGSCKTQPLSNGTKIIVNREELEELLSELRLKTPEEIKRYQKIISNKEAILADAKAKADEIIARAEVQTNELVSEHEIMQQAYAQANEVVSIAAKQAEEILNNANEDANMIRTGAIAYTDEMLGRLESIISQSIETSKTRTENFISSMQAHLNTVLSNRAELLNADQQGEAQQDQAAEAPAVEPSPFDTSSPK